MFEFCCSVDGFSSRDLKFETLRKDNLLLDEETFSAMLEATQFIDGTLRKEVGKIDLRGSGING
jgi:hypothetical protein